MINDSKCNLSFIYYVNIMIQRVILALFISKSGRALIGNCLLVCLMGETDYVYLLGYSNILQLTF